MKKNMSSNDRIIRVIFALVIVGLFFTKLISGTWAIVLLVFAGIFILTSFVSYCPLYSLFNISTSKNPAKTSI
ncbi:MAG: DUF2892 domain-containing protein [Saprospiraceae bacterium]